MKLGKIVNRLNLSNNSLVVIQNGSALATDQTLVDFQREIKKLNLNVFVVLADRLDDLKMLPEKEMAKYGWFRIETLQRLALSPKERNDSESIQD